jgi:hypothetical protein
MARTILIDTGAVVAALNKRDQHHEWARSNFESLALPDLRSRSVRVFFSVGAFALGKEGVLCVAGERHYQSGVFLAGATSAASDPAVPRYTYELC